MLRVQFINLQTLDLSGNSITYIDNLRANKVLFTAASDYIP